METVNILGDTQKQQWLTAIRIYSVAIEANINDAIGEIHVGLYPEREYPKSLDTALKVLGDFTDEMRRLVEGVFDD